ncbi:MAG: hypothetical protein QOI08_2191 [Actinomycetota bacterium]|nr:hypothetical protein [Actinomycetota bacterium]
MTMSMRTLFRRTIRLRLTALYGGLFLASGAALLAVTYVLVSHATAGAPFVARNSDGSSSVIMRSGGTGSPDVPPKGTVGTQVLNGVGPVSLTPGQAAAQLRQLEGQARHQHANEMHQLLLQSAIALGVMTVISIVLGWLVAGRVLRPLRTITTAARDRSATNLHERLDLSGPNDELKELGDTFDALFERLEGSFRSQRQFVANASHELRTPLARQRALSQVALGDPDATIESLRTAHERVLVSGAQQERLIDALLTLTRVQAGLEREQSFDLATVADRVVLGRRSDAEHLGLVLDAALSPVSMQGDPRLIERLIVNLVDNAMRHNTEQGSVEVVTGVRDGHAIVAVVNTGPVVPESEIERLLQPFQRLDGNRTGHEHGLGLGLSVVQAIADAHGATLVLRPRAGGGLDVEVAFDQVVTARTFTGSDTANRVPPPGADSARAVPPIAAASSRTIARPSPVPTARPAVPRTV